MQLKSYTGATKYTTTTSTTSYCITETVFLNHAISLSTHYRTVLLEQPKVSHAANTFPECFEASLVVTFQIPIQLQQKRFIFIPSDPPPCCHTMTLPVDLVVENKFSCAIPGFLGL